MPPPKSDIAFTQAVKALRAARGSRAAFAEMEARGGFRTAIDEDLATAKAEGQPYARHRGGPLGFLHVIDDHTLGFVDFAGNRQYVTTGNLAESDKAFLFLMDYAHRRRIELWGRARLETQIASGDAT